MNPTETSAPIWSDSLLLGHAAIDGEHEQLAELIERMRCAAAPEMAQALDAVLQHAASHFAAENELMRTTAFPPRDCHIDEHAAVLKSLEEVKERLVQGDFFTVRDFARELAKWFPGHADYLDSALSHWMSKLRTGGKPIVLRRKLSFDGSVIPETK